MAGEKEFAQAMQLYSQGRYSEALPLMKRASDQGHRDAMYKLGEMYETGMEDDFQVVSFFYGKAKEYVLGWKYESSIKKNRDTAAYYYYEAAKLEHSDALVSLKRLARAGNTDSQYNLAKLYENGQGVAKDYEGAAYYYYEAAKLEHSDALVGLKRLARAGNADSHYNLAKLYENGQGVVKNYEEAANYYYEAAKQDYSDALVGLKRLAGAGNADSYYNLAKLYENGQGVAKDYEEAANYYYEAARRDHSLALARLKPLAKAQNVIGQYNLAQIYYYYSSDTAEDDMEAVYWYFNAAKQEHADALSMLEKIAHHGNVIAQYNLAEMYYHGSGIGEDHTQAMEWYFSAARHEHADAQYSLASMYENAQGVAQDYNEAADYYYEAAKQCHDDALTSLKRLAEAGYSGAQNNLGTMYYRGDGEIGENDVLAMQWFEKAANQGCVRAQCNLGKICQNGGVGIAKNIALAVYWYREAAKQEYEDAVKGLKTIKMSAKLEGQIQRVAQAIEAERQAVVAKKHQVQVQKKQKSVGQKVQAQEDYLGQASNQLSFRKGDLLELIEPLVKGWKKGWIKCKLDGSIGIVPGNYVDPYKLPPLPSLPRVAGPGFFDEGSRSRGKKDRQSSSSSSSSSSSAQPRFGSSDD